MLSKPKDTGGGKAPTNRPLNQTAEERTIYRSDARRRQRANKKLELLFDELDAFAEDEPARLASEQEQARLIARPRLAAQTARQIHSAPMRRGARSSAQEALNYAQMARRYAIQAQSQANINRRRPPPGREMARQSAFEAPAAQEAQAQEAQAAQPYERRRPPPGRTMARQSAAQVAPAQEAAFEAVAQPWERPRLVPPGRTMAREQQTTQPMPSRFAQTFSERIPAAVNRQPEFQTADISYRPYERPRLIPPGKTMASAGKSSVDARQSAQDARQFAQDARRYAIEANDAGIVTHMRSVDAGLDYALGKTQAEDYADEAAYSSDKARRRATQARQAADEAAMTGARLYDEVRKIEREATVLAGDNKATLFDGQELGVGPDESNHDDMAGKELYVKAGPRADAVDVSQPYSRSNHMSESDSEKDPLMSKRIADQHRAAINYHREQGNLLSRSGNLASLNANAYGQAQMPDVNRPADIGEEDRRLRDLRGGPDSALVPISDDVLAARAQHMNRQRVQNPNFRAQNKWNPTIGRGNKFILSTAPNSLQTIRDAQIPYRQPGRRVRGNAVDLVRLGNQTSTKILNQYQP